MSQFIVMEASAQVPASWKHRGGPRGYRKVALVEVEDGAIPRMISERAKGVIRVMRVWDRLFEGKTERSEYFVSLKRAHEYAARLNAGERWNHVYRAPEPVRHLEIHEEFDQ